MEVFRRTYWPVLSRLSAQTVWVCLCRLQHWPLFIVFAILLVIFVSLLRNDLIVQLHLAIPDLLVIESVYNERGF